MARRPSGAEPISGPIGTLGGHFCTPLQMRFVASLLCFGRGMAPCSKSVIAADSSMCDASTRTTSTHGGCPKLGRDPAQIRQTETANPMPPVLVKSRGRGRNGRGTAVPIARGSAVQMDGSVLPYGAVIIAVEVCCEDVPQRSRQGRRAGVVVICSR